MNLATTGILPLRFGNPNRNTQVASLSKETTSDACWNSVRRRRSTVHNSQGYQPTNQVVST
ncbi:MAG: hypothetical protein QNJ54_02785 [Prochloraceae cyanobacterium]|nr:hypothetical protein [Prochloraceae cyanobacterium]